MCLRHRIALTIKSLLLFIANIANTAAQCNRSLLMEGEFVGTITTDFPEESPVFHTATYICNDGCETVRVCQSDMTLPGNLPDCPGE